MKKILIFGTALLALLGAVLFFAPKESEAAVPIDWDTLTMEQESPRASMMRDMLVSSTAYLIGNDLPSTSGTAFVFESGEEKDIRPAAQQILAFAVAEKFSFVSTTPYQLLVQDVSAAHNVIWGGCWQCAHWAYFAGLGAWLNWETLPKETQDAVESMVVLEAERLLHTLPEYCNGCQDDSKAEELAWNANLLYLASVMMPNHPQTEAWESHARLFMRSAIAGPNAQLPGWNIEADGTLYNHDRIHPDYMAAMHMQLWNVLIAELAQRKAPEEAIVNTDLVYQALESRYWEDTPQSSSTIYIPGQAPVFYPEGTGWSPVLIDNFFLFDVYTDLLSLDEGLVYPASYWADLRTEAMREMQLRSDDGAFYQKEDGLHYRPKESKAAAWVALAYLAERILPK